MKTKKKTATPHKAPRVRPVLRETELSRALVKAWMQVVFSLAKLPGGTSAAKDNPEPVLNRIIRRELSAIRDLWEIFNLERDLINKRLLGTKQHTVAYLLGFHLPNAARMALLWRHFVRRFPEWKKTFQSSDLIINDIGCGTGALAQSLVSELTSSGIDANQMELNLSDVAAGPLEAAELVIKKMTPDLAVKRHGVAVEKLRTDRFSREKAGDRDPLFIYTLGYVWNELRKNRAAQKNLETILIAHAARNELALVFLVEPAAELQSRDAMQLRDQLVAGGLTAIYPCPPLQCCPMIERPKDWCFTEGRWKRPAHAEVIDRSLGIDRAWLGASLYAFASPRMLKALRPDQPDQPDRSGVKKSGVIVGRPQVAATPAGKADNFEYLLCTIEGLKKSTPAKGAKPLPRGDTITN